MTVRIYERTSISRHTFDSIAASGSGGGEMNLFGENPKKGDKFHSGVLRGVAVSCNSTDFDVSIRSKSDGLEDTVDELYKVTGIDLYRRDDVLNVGWMNGDSPLKGSLYLVLTNNDSVNATGEVSIEIHTDIPKRFSHNR